MSVFPYVNKLCACIPGPISNCQNMLKMWKESCTVYLSQVSAHVNVFALSDKIIAADFDIVWSDGLLCSVFKLLIAIVCTDCCQSSWDILFSCCRFSSHICWVRKNNWFYTKDKFVAGLKAPAKLYALNYMSKLLLADYWFRFFISHELYRKRVSRWFTKQVLFVQFKKLSVNSKMV